MPVVRAALFTVLLLAAVVLQTAFFPYFALDGATPNVVLLVVVAAALTRGPEFAAVLGFFGGLLIDLAPPADHVAGRWALALMVVGYLAGKVRPEAGRSAMAALATVGAALLRRYLDLRAVRPADDRAVGQRRRGAARHPARPASRPPARALRAAAGPPDLPAGAAAPGRLLSEPDGHRLTWRS